MDFVEACLDEIALEGLDGITLSALWIRLNNRNFPLPLMLDDLMKAYLWSSVLRGNDSVEFYELPKPRSPLVLFDRFANMDPETGVIIREEGDPEDIYPICLVKDDPDGIMGSCADFHTRTNVTDVVRKEETDLNSVLQRWGEKFVIVGSQLLRSMALFGCREFDPDVLSTITDLKYAVLERIGRSRYHGELTQSRDGLKVFSMTPKAMFYFRKILRIIGLITVQPISIRFPHSGSVNGKLIHLTRFFKEYRPKYMVLLEGLTTRLSVKPNQREEISVMRSEMGLKEKPFRKLVVLGRSHVKSELMKFKDAFPESTTRPLPKKSSSADRFVRVLSLIKPFIVALGCNDDDDDENEKFGRGKGDDESEKDMEDLELTTVAVGKEFASRAPALSLICERPFLHQVMSCIEMLGGMGQSHIDIANQFSITKLDSRMICRNLSRKGLTITCMQDEGKTRVSRFVSKRAVTNDTAPATQPVEEASHEEDGSESLIVKVEDELVCRENSSALTAKTAKVAECKTVKADEKEKEKLLKLLEVFPAVTTIRMLRRAETILTAIEKARVVSDTVLIQRKIRSEEATASMMDRRSFMTLIDKLCTGSKIRKIFNIIPMSNGRQKEVVLLCAASVTDDDLLVQSALEAIRQKLISVKEDGAELTANKADNEESAQYDPSACRRYGYLPRLARMRTLHQLLWSLVYGKRVKQPPHHAQQGQTTLPTVACETTSSLLSDDFYSTTEVEEKSNEASWHRNLPQLPRHSGYDDGWCCIFDILQVIPISIVCQCISIPYVINGLENYLKDPVNRATPYNQLPVEWQHIISQKRRYITFFYNDCRSLAMLGLITFGKRNFKQKEQCFLYIHKRATLVNTTRSDIPRSEFFVCSFLFETFANVEDYWLSFQSLSFNTPRENMPTTCSRRAMSDGRFDDCLAEKEVGKVVDDGTLPGDGMGAAGTDSTFYSHLRRNWSHNTSVDVKMESLIDDGHYLVNERAKTRALQGKTKKKKQIKPDTPPDVVPKKEKSSKAKNDESVKFTKEVVSGVVPKKGGKGVARKRNCVVEGLLKKSRKVCEKRDQLTDADKLTNAALEKALRKRKHDPKDVDAIRLLKRHRVTWTPQEDSLLLLCQLTNQFLSGYEKLCMVGNAVIRDVMHDNLTISRDKTRLACIRRIKYMMKNNVTMQNVRMYLGELLQDKELIAEFFKDGEKFSMKNSAKNGPVFKRCLEKIREKFRCENESVPDIPNTLAEVFERFSDVKATTGYGTSTHRDVSCVSDIHYTVLHNLIHSSIVLTDKICRSRELFQLLYQYPETIVESVFKTMKNDRILTKIKKGTAKTSRTGAIPLTRFGTFQIAQRYMYYWHSNYLHNIFAVVGSSIYQFPPNPDGSAFGSDFLVLRGTMSHSVMTIALMTLRLVTFETTIPEQIVVIDSMSKEEKSVEQPKKKKRKTEDDESDLEEEALIEVAERDRAQEAMTTQDALPKSSDELPDSSAVDATPSVIMYSKSQSSRTVLSIYRCQYVHSKTIRLINVNDNLFVNACDVRVRLKPTELRDADDGNCETTKWASDAECRQEITAWNQSHIALHPKTCQMILMSIRCIYPDRIRPSVAFDACLRRRSKDRELLTSVYEELKRHEHLGLTIYQLREAFSGVDGCKLMDLVAVMIESKLVVRVGVTVFRYACLEFAGSWLIRIDKNLKGRGIIDIDEEEDVQIDPCEVDSSTPSTTSNSTPSTSSSSLSSSSSSTAVDACSSLNDRCHKSTDNESSLQFVPSESTRKRLLSESRSDEISQVKRRRVSENGENVEPEEMVEPQSKSPKLCEEVHQETSDGKNASDCVERTEEIVVPSANSLQLMEDSLEPPLSKSVHQESETFPIDMGRAVTDKEIPKLPAECVGENLETVSPGLKVGDETLSSSLNCSDASKLSESDVKNKTEMIESNPVSSDFRFTLSSSLNCSEASKLSSSDVKNKTEMIESNSISSDFVKPTSDSQILFDGIVCSSSISDSQTSANALSPSPSSASSSQLKPSVEDVTERQAVVTKSKPHLCYVSESTSSQIDRFDAPTANSASKSASNAASKSASNAASKSASNAASKSPARESVSVASTSKSPSCKATPVSSPSNLLSVKNANISKPSPVCRRAPVTSALKSPVRKTPSVSNSLKCPASRSTPPIKSKSVRKRAPVTSTSKSPASKTTSVSTTSKSPVRKSPTTTVHSSTSPTTTSRGLANASFSDSERNTKPIHAAESNERANPSTTDSTSDSYFSSLINSTPKVLKRPRDFLKNRPSSERRGRTAAKVQGSPPRPIRLPSWMPPAQVTEPAEVQTSPSTAIRKTRRVSMSEDVTLDALEMKSNRNASKMTVTAATSKLNSSLSSLDSTPTHVTPPLHRSLLSSPRSDFPISPSPLVSPVIPAQRSTLLTTPQAKQSVATSPRRKQLPTVRMATSGTCTTITIVSPQRETKWLEADATESEAFGITSPVSTIGRSAIARNSETQRVPSDTMYRFSSGGGASQQQRDRFASSKKAEGITPTSSQPPSSSSDRFPRRPPVGSPRFGSPSASLSVGSIPAAASMSYRPSSSSDRFPRRPPVGSPRFGSPSASLGVGSIPAVAAASGGPSTSQAIRIRVPASSLGSVSGTNELARQIQEMLTKQGSLKPGQQVRLRLPPGVTLQNLGLASPPSCPHPNPAVANNSGQLIVGAGQCVVSYSQSVVSHQPSVSCGQPSVSCGQPSVSCGQPLVSCGQPSVSCGQPLVSCGQPLVSCGQPAVSSGQPSVSSGQPLVSSGQPAVSFGRLSAVNNTSVSNQGSETLCVPRRRTGSEQVTSDKQAGKQSHFRLPQVDGAGDENSMDTSDVVHSPLDGATSDSTVAAVDNSNVDGCTTENGSLHDIAVVDTSDAQPPIQLTETTPNVAETPPLENGTDSQSSSCPPPAPKGTYKKVRLIPRPWRTPEGTVNRPTLQAMLEALMLFIIEMPGLTREALVEKYTPVLQPVAIFELVEMLEEIGCIQRMYIRRSHKPTLFSTRSTYRIVSEDLGKETEVFQPTAGCIMKLGQFVAQLTSGLRNSDS